jgi:hypothetical protein
MYTLIPQKYNQRLTNDYRLRVLTVLFFGLAIATLIGVASLLPSYIISEQSEKDAVTTADEIRKDRESRGVDVLEGESKEANRLTSALIGDSDPASFSGLVNDIAGKRMSGIYITSFMMKSSGTTTLEAVIKGKASTRDSLVNYRRKMVEDTRFTKVDLPISDLAKSKDIPFTLTVSASI